MITFCQPLSHRTADKSRDIGGGKMCLVSYVIAWLIVWSCSGASKSELIESDYRIRHGTILPMLSNKETMTVSKHSLADLVRSKGSI